MKFTISKLSILYTGTMKSKLFIIVVLIFLTPAQVMSTSPVNYSWADHENWYYKKSETYMGWKYIVIHHSATQAGSVKAFHKFHTRQGYGGIAYHFVIGNGNGMKDGEIQETFRWTQKISGTHVSVNSWDHNVFGIGIVLVGDFENTQPTNAQVLSLRKLIIKLKFKHNIESKNVYGHKHVHYDNASGKKEQTVCPGVKLDINIFTKANKKETITNL